MFTVITQLALQNVTQPIIFKFSNNNKKPHFKTILEVNFHLKNLTTIHILNFNFLATLL